MFHLGTGGSRRQHAILATAVLWRGLDGASKFEDNLAARVPVYFSGCSGTTDDDFFVLFAKPQNPLAGTVGWDAFGTHPPHIRRGRH